MADSMKKREIPDAADDVRPDTVATPEGDNEYGFDQPLPDGTEPVPERIDDRIPGERDRGTR